MANQVHRITLVAETALDFDTSFAQIDSLPAGDLCWCAPVTTMEDCDIARVWAAISSGATSPEGAIEFWAGRAGSNLRPASGFGNTLTDHGTEGTAADISDMLAGLQLYESVKVSTADTVYTVQFDIELPGPSWQLFIYNNTDEALDGTSSPHSAYAVGLGPEIQ